MVPHHTKAEIDRYVKDRIITGSFLHAVLSNDLFGAVIKADDFNRIALPDIVSYIHNNAPMGCYGSAQVVEDWIEGKDLKNDGM